MHAKLFDYYFLFLRDFLEYFGVKWSDQNTVVIEAYLLVCHVKQESDHITGLPSGLVFDLLVVGIVPY